MLKNAQAVVQSLLSQHVNSMAGSSVVGAEALDGTPPDATWLDIRLHASAKHQYAT